MDSTQVAQYMALKQVAAMLKFISDDYDGERFTSDAEDVFNAIEGARLLIDGAITVTEQGE